METDVAREKEIQTLCEQVLRMSADCYESGGGWGYTRCPLCFEEVRLWQGGMGISHTVLIVVISLQKGFQPIWTCDMKAWSEQRWKAKSKGGLIPPRTTTRSEHRRKARANWVRSPADRKWPSTAERRRAMEVRSLRWPQEVLWIRGGSKRYWGSIPRHPTIRP